jgi:hypothetical protein
VGDTPPTVAASKRALLEVAPTGVKVSPVGASAHAAVPAPVVPPAPVAPPTSMPDVEAEADSREPSARRRRWLLPALVGGGALAVLAIVLATYGSNEPPTTTRPTSGPGSAAVAPVTSVATVTAPAPDAAVAVPPISAEPSEPIASGSANQLHRSDHKAPAKKLEHHRIAAAGAQPGGLAVEVSAAHPAASGFFSIDAKPYADIFVDGAPFGQTPLVHKSLSAGKHHIKAVRADGATTSYDVIVPANAAAAAIHVAW